MIATGVNVCVVRAVHCPNNYRYDTYRCFEDSNEAVSYEGEILVRLIFDTSFLLFGSELGHLLNGAQNDS